MKIYLTLIFLFSFSLWAEPPKRIIIVGDSLTEGYGVDHDQAYPALIQKKALAEGKNWMIINSGISGSTSASAPSRMRAILKENPTLVILALGANDGLNGLKVAAMEKNLSDAIDLCKKAQVKLILAGMQMPPNLGKDYTRDFAAAFPRVAKKMNVPLIPFLLKDVGGIEALNQSDQIHPNEKGHQIIADTVYPFIKKELK